MSEARATPIASLAMYPFEHLRDSYDALWASVRSRLGPDRPERLDRTTELRAAWREQSLLVGQTCGWPLITQLHDEVTVIGAFDVNVPFAAGGRYRSVIIADKPISIDDWRRSAATVVAVNGPDSLSGWISMRVAWSGEPPTMVTTGSHAESMRAVASGRANLASIDALSFEFLVATDPMLGGRVHIVGHGPLVPCLPLVMANRLAHRRDEVRAAFAAAVDEPALAPACEALRIGGFVPFDLADYETLAALAPRPAR